MIAMLMKLLQCFGLLNFTLLPNCISFCQTETTFTNLLLPSSADPWSIYKDGYNYYINSGGDSLVLYKRKPGEAQNCHTKDCFCTTEKCNLFETTLSTGIYSIEGKWYMYFAADNGKNEDYRLYVLENKSLDPMEAVGNSKVKL